VACGAHVIEFRRSPAPTLAIIRHLPRESRLVTRHLRVGRNLPSTNDLAACRVNKIAEVTWALWQLSRHRPERVPWSPRHRRRVLVVDYQQEASPTPPSSTREAATYRGLRTPGCASFSVPSSTKPTGLWRARSTHFLSAFEAPLEAPRRTFVDICEVPHDSPGRGSPNGHPIGRARPLNFAYAVPLTDTTPDERGSYLALDR
jgi:hypothetical protein